MQARNHSPRLFVNSIRLLIMIGVLADSTSGLATESDQANDTTFDVQALKARGVDPRMGELFRNAPRFLPGETTVALTVNGKGRGKVKARFDQSGMLCADKSFQKAAGC